ncbi:unnamed protein product, partial [Schistosoma intercalatum]
MNKKTEINNCRTKTEKVKVQAGYTEANKLVERNIKADKWGYMEHFETTAEKNARDQNMRQLYDITKKLAGKYS